MKTIPELRKEKDLTQLQLANILGMTPATIHNWERGNSEPGAAQFRALAAALGVRMEDIELPPLKKKKNRQGDESS